MDYFFCKILWKGQGGHLWDHYTDKYEIRDCWGEVYVNSIIVPNDDRLMMPRRIYSKEKERSLYNFIVDHRNEDNNPIPIQKIWQGMINNIFKNKYFIELTKEIKKSEADPEAYLETKLNKIDELSILVGPRKNSCYLLKDVIKTNVLLDDDNKFNALCRNLKNIYFIKYYMAREGSNFYDAVRHLDNNMH